jgi:hypothetical protein
MIERETDPTRLRQRQKQVDLGKNTSGYDRYLSAVPRAQRNLAEREASHPVTPDISRKCSKRAFDGVVKKWRRQLHQFWDPPGTATSAGDAAGDEDGEDHDTVHADSNRVDGAADIRSVAQQRQQVEEPDAVADAGMTAEQREMLALAQELGDDDFVDAPGGEEDDAGGQHAEHAQRQDAPEEEQLLLVNSHLSGLSEEDRRSLGM